MRMIPCVEDLGVRLGMVPTVEELGCAIFSPRDVPVRPHLSVFSYTDSSITLMFVDGYDSESTITDRYITQTVVSKQSTSLIPVVVTNDKITIDNLNPSTTYYFKAHTRNTFGYSLGSIEISQTTGDGVSNDMNFSQSSNSVFIPLVF